MKLLSLPKFFETFINYVMSSILSLYCVLPFLVVTAEDWNGRDDGRVLAKVCRLLFTRPLQPGCVEMVRHEKVAELCVAFPIHVHSRLVAVVVSSFVVARFVQPYRDREQPMMMMIHDHKPAEASANY